MKLVNLYIQYVKQEEEKKNICNGKAKFNKENGEIMIYEKCNNNENIHKTIAFES